jgi:hypothetical protein
MFQEGHAADGGAKTRKGLDSPNRAAARWASREGEMRLPISGNLKRGVDLSACLDHPGCTGVPGIGGPSARGGKACLRRFAEGTDFGQRRSS